MEQRVQVFSSSPSINRILWYYIYFLIFLSGSEPGSFWSAIGGKKEYVTTPFKTLPKVFFCVNEMGEFKAKRLFEGQYCQGKKGRVRERGEGKRGREGKRVREGGKRRKK